MLYKTYHRHKIKAREKKMSIIRYFINIYGIIINEIK